MMVKLLCAIVGAGGSALSVRLDDDDQVADLIGAIKAQNKDLEIPARKLRLFLAKMTDGAWLKDNDPAAQALSEGKTHPNIQQVIDGKQAIATRTLKRWLFDDNKMLQPSTEEIHVLVVVPKDYVFLRVKEIDNNADYKDELLHYRQRGELIQRNCENYCQQILSKIDALYALSGWFGLPFICVEGSSGMGKSQLAFALGGNRPWFYWPVAIGLDSQRLYRNFSSISDAFLEVTNKDDPTKRSEEVILDRTSLFYNTESLWTFGFIYALLKYCSKEKKQQGQMIRFQEEATLHLEKCNREKVVDFREKMKAEGKILPFFVLDEMTLNTHVDGGGKKLAAFQRNVFRVCALVVVLMGSDDKITKMISKPPLGSYCGRHAWMTIFSRFPPYQPIPYADKDKGSAWNYLQAQYPILNRIVVNSRGRFARYFVDSAVKYAMENFANGIRLCDLLDAAFDRVSSETQSNNSFMEKQEGKDAQLMAISYINAGTGETSPPPYEKRKVAQEMGAFCMDLHFANLAVDQATEVDIIGSLKVNSMPWEPLYCFPAIEEDLLLYLAILGGKTYSGYYDRQLSIDHSTLGIFSACLKGKGVTTGVNTNALSNNYKTFDNMVAHMFFCASRRNGVQGIPFDNFFAGLLSECQDEIRPVTMTDGNTGKTIVASDILNTYADLEALSRSKIPFLAPPNAEWPRYILDTRAEGCNFGHLVRAGHRCEVFVCNMKDRSTPPLFLCECKYWDKNVDSGVMSTIIGGLETVWKEKWVVALVFCAKLATFENEWIREKVGCVKVDCRSGRVDWVFQPAHEKRKKLVIVMGTGHLSVGVP
ncbi:hypothetical protein KXD40_008930 [Peronospora effusa]|nr:hypothetical protein KXD40_008930 [Peronospora effusa]